jgi:hypothetical protein
LPVSLFVSTFFYGAKDGKIIKQHYENLQNASRNCY